MSTLLASPARTTRRSAHPGQYTVLGSPSETVTEAALADLEVKDKGQSGLAARALLEARAAA